MMVASSFLAVFVSLLTNAFADPFPLSVDRVEAVHRPEGYEFASERAESCACRSKTNGCVVTSPAPKNKACTCCMSCTCSLYIRMVIVTRVKRMDGMMLMVNIIKIKTAKVIN